MRKYLEWAVKERRDILSQGALPTDIANQLSLFGLDDAEVLDFLRSNPNADGIDFIQGFLGRGINRRLLGAAADLLIARGLLRR